MSGFQRGLGVAAMQPVVCVRCGRKGRRGFIRSDVGWLCRDDDNCIPRKVPRKVRG